MSWITLVTILIAWSVVGLGVAYLFGRFVHEGEIPRSADAHARPVVSYLRRVKRAKTSSGATARVEARRVAGAEGRY